MIVGALTCALFHYVYHLKTAQMNMQCCLIWKFLLYEFKLGHNSVETTKNICCAKCEGTIDHNTVNKWLKKFHSGYKNLTDQERSGSPTSMESEGVLLSQYF